MSVKIAMVTMRARLEIATTMKHDYDGNVKMLKMTMMVAMMLSMVKKTTEAVKFNSRCCFCYRCDCCAWCPECCAGSYRYWYMTLFLALLALLPTLRPRC